MLKLADFKNMSDDEVIEYITHEYEIKYKQNPDSGKVYQCAMTLETVICSHVS